MNVNFDIRNIFLSVNEQGKDFENTIRNPAFWRWYSPSFCCIEYTCRF